MNITLLTPKISFSPVKRGENSHNSTPVMHSKLSPLSADTVSFTGDPIKKVSTGYTILQHLCAHYEVEETPRLVRLAKNFLNASFSAAENLKDRGFRFDMEYNSKHPVKSWKSYGSKIERSKSLTVYDPIRDTMYCKDPYDMDNINALLSEMYDSGYVLAEVDMPLTKLMKRGYIPTVEELQKGVQTVKVPDIDFRLDTEFLDVDNMPENLKYFVSGKIPSGLEDIQMRFIRPCDIGKSNPVYHEMLVMFGEHSTAAKNVEHRDVYQWVRRFEELEFPVEDNSLKTHGGKAKNYLSLIKDMFRGKVSQKLFLNAKNKDTRGVFDESQIFFTESDIRLFEGYFGGLRDRVSSVYTQLRKQTPSANLMRTRDLNRIQEIYEGLANTINYYNYKAGYPLIEIKKPTK